MHITTIEKIPNKEVAESLGMVKGSTVRARHVGVDIISFFILIFGGRMAGYTKAIRDARSEAEKEMVAEAEKLGANAVVGVRYATSQVVSGAAEVMVYGTAVKTK